MSNKSWKDSLKIRKYDEHKHCMVCGNAIPLERDFCSQECKDNYNKADKKKSKKNIIQIVVLGALMVVMFLVLPKLMGTG